MRNRTNSKKYESLCWLRNIYGSSQNQNSHATLFRRNPMPARILRNYGSSRDHSLAQNSHADENSVQLRLDPKDVQAIKISWAEQIQKIVRGLNAQ